MIWVLVFFLNGDLHRMEFEDPATCKLGGVHAESILKVKWSCYPKREA